MINEVGDSIKDEPTKKSFFIATCHEFLNFIALLRWVCSPGGNGNF